MDKVHLTWAEVERCVSRVISQLESDYDCMLVVTRGGLVPACLISERINLRNILVAAVMFYTGVDQTLEEPVFHQFPESHLLAGKKILVVDDVWDSGRTIMAVRKLIHQAQGRPSIAVLHYKPERSSFPDDKPDYYGTITNEWLVYPWDPESEHSQIQPAAAAVASPQP